MTPLPFALVLFLAAVAAVAVLTPVLGIRALAQARVEAALGVESVSPRARVERAVRRVVFALAALGAICIGYGRLVEPFWPKVERVRITSTKWPRGAAPLRIVHISDPMSHRVR